MFQNGHNMPTLDILCPFGLPDVVLSLPLAVRLLLLVLVLLLVLLATSY
jgi:hypothetical protein